MSRPQGKHPLKLVITSREYFRNPHDSEHRQSFMMTPYKNL